MSWRSLFQTTVIACSILILAGIPRSSDAAALDSKKTDPPFRFRIVTDPPVTSVVNNFRKLCCDVGRSAAKKQYSCYITRNIASSRMNMPMRETMKTSVHGEKWDYAFARVMEFCAKVYKFTRRFQHCCNKEARKMDWKRSQ